MIFVDTTFWVGDADLNDEFHSSSHVAIEKLRIGQTPLAITTDFVIDETVTILGRRKGFGAREAAAVGAHLIASPRVFVVYVDEDILLEALGKYPSYGGKLSLTDVVSAVTMTRYAVKQILSHDADFDSVKGITRLESI